MISREKKRAPLNRTITLTEHERALYGAQLTRPPFQTEALRDAIVQADLFAILPQLPRAFTDLLILDPPYNLSKKFGGETFREMDLDAYERWFESWFVQLLPALKKTSSIYVCGDWKSSAALHRVLDRHVMVRNRITWEREKGRGAQLNWKNACEDIWFCTVSNDYFFNVEAVKLRRRVLAPYKANGAPKGWQESQEGGFRLTHPSNLWTDLSVPYWSMRENTDHPTQKPEKLMAKLMLASTRPEEMVFDPFLGSGTSAAAATKLNRHFVGIEIDEDFCCLAAKRVESAKRDSAIQGYSGGVFWERNSLADQVRQRGRKTKSEMGASKEMAFLL